MRLPQPFLASRRAACPALATRAATGAASLVLVAMAAAVGTPAARAQTVIGNPGAAVSSGAAGAIVSGSAAATPVTPAGANTAPSAAAEAGARFVESCQQAIERGMVNPGCQGPLYGSEIARLKEDALRTQNPALLTLLGDAYQSNRSGISDIGQAYRWYLLGAVRGDPRAMQRLSDLYRNGQGVPKDNIKALGYARLAQRLALPGSQNAKGAAETINSLGQEMAAEETALADRFASELEAQMRQPPGAAASGTPGMPGTASPPPAAALGPAGPKLSGPPGLGALRAAEAAAPAASPAPAPAPARSPLGGFPGQEALPATPAPAR
ncbi:sel1 repeat family protein [Pseudacidovorax sp. NFM-22]|uniref:sel1 repeat family protein n=1 Tax=Pseudacidovorax sp. NFM-22 TaxID=2744469 RepID=UPI001F375AB2|nr:sel1 repeat family protein [Pseudacidovorax sp. NFM-22]